LAPLCALAPVAVPVAVGVGFALVGLALVGLALVGLALVGLALVGFALMVRVGVGVAEVLLFAVLGVADGLLFWVVVLFGFVGVADGVLLAEALRVLVRVADGLAFAVALAEVGVADSVLVGALVGVSAGVLAGDFTMDFVGTGDLVGVAAGLDFSVRVGAGGGSDGVAAELAECVGVPAVALPVVVGDWLAEAGADVGAVGVWVGVAGVVLGAAGVVPGVVGVGVGVVGAAVGVCDVGVGVGDGLGDEVGGCSGSHDLPLAVVPLAPLAVVAAFAAVVPATITARLVPEAAVSRTLPAISVAVAGRACPKRIETPYQCCSLLLRNDSSSLKWPHRSDSPAAVAIRHPLDIRRLDGATRSPTRFTAVITTLSMIMCWSWPGCRSGC
jgi:hypothetical protein